MAHLFWLSDEAWAAIEPHLPHGNGKAGKPRVDIDGISGILHVLRTGYRWRDVPLAYGLRGGSGSGSSGGWPPLDRSPTSYRSTAPRQSPPFRGRSKKGEFVEAIGRSRGGRTSMNCTGSAGGRFVLATRPCAAIPMLRSSWFPPQQAGCFRWAREGGGC